MTTPFSHRDERLRLAFFPALLASLGAMLAGPAASQSWFDAPVALPNTVGADYKLHGDVDRDGDEDLFLFTGSSFEVWLNDGTGAFSFATRRPYSPAQSIAGLVPRFGDVTGDGLGDVVVSRRQGTGAILVYPGQDGGAWFGPPISAPFPAVPVAFCLGDSLGNGGTDIGVAFAAPGLTVTVSWLRFSAGSLIESRGPTLQHAAFHLCALDADGDNDDDLVAGDSLGNSVELLPTVAGVPTLGTSFPVPGTTAVRGVVAGDLDGDGDDDVLVHFFVFSTRTLHLTVLEQTAAGLVQRPTQQVPAVTGPRSMHAADWDGDGDLDVLAGSTWVQCIRNDGGLRFSHGATVELGWDGRGVGAADFNADGKTDFCGPRVLKFGDGTFHDTHVSPYATRGIVSQTALFDLDGDLDLDVVDASGSLAINDGTGRFAVLTSRWPAAPPNHGFSSAAAFADFNGDGLGDYLVPLMECIPIGMGCIQQFRRMHLLVGTSALGFIDVGPVMPPGTRILTSSQAALHSLVADVDNDGDRDVIDRDVVHLNNGVGLFTPRVGAVPGQVYADAADVDGDGNIDLLGEAFAGGSEMLVVSFGAAGLQFTSQTVYTVPQGGLIANRSPRFLDLDGDGDLDIACTTAGFPVGNAVQLIENRGGVFQHVGSQSLGRDPAEVLALDDLDGDGALDLLAGPRARGSFDTVVHVFTRTGAGVSFGNGRRFRADKMRHWADLDGDGDLDALGERRFFGWAVDSLARGLVRQYGPGAVGSGGLVPVLGARGPLVVGAQAELRVRAGLGGAPGVLVLGFGETLLPGVPVPGITLLVQPIAAVVPAVLSGSVGLPGAGELSLGFGLGGAPPGWSLFAHSVWLDPAGPSGLSASNGLELRAGR